jgi:RNA polymerase sigma-70 factor (ECF subfamily)
MNAEGEKRLDINEFTSRVENVQERLYRTAFLYLGSEAMVLEAVSETVYKALKSLRKLRQAEFFETWLTRILINECKKELRRRKRELPYEALPETAEKAFDALPLKEAVHRLPNELREIIILRYFTGLTLSQTAESLGIPQGTVATRQRRALALLKLDLKED